MKAKLMSTVSLISIFMSAGLMTAHAEDTSAPAPQGHQVIRQDNQAIKAATSQVRADRAKLKEDRKARRAAKVKRHQDRQQLRQARHTVQPSQ